MQKRCGITGTLLAACLFLTQAPALQGASLQSLPCTRIPGHVSVHCLGEAGYSDSPSFLEIRKDEPVHFVRGDITPPVQPLFSVIRTLEAETGFRFLYRDALVSGVDIPFHYSEDWREDLADGLHAFGLDVVLNEERKQAVLFRRISVQVEIEGDSHRILEGFVIDMQTGERLPFATVVWFTHEDVQVAGTLQGAVRSSPLHSEPVNLHGVQTDLQGRFRLAVPTGEDLHLRISYVGYHTNTIVITAGDLPKIGELSVRLAPAALEGKEIVVLAPVLHQPAGNGNTGSLMLDGFSPLGETNSVRMLQILPSVGLGTALSDGAIVRGSSSDAMQILLDGSVIYNQSHLFGLVDSFSSDAIRTSSFHYDVTPARYQGPPGGTLSLITRAGSLHRFRGSAGVSSSALSGGLEGPLLRGRSSWLLSGRTSLLNGHSFPGTEDLVAWGLNVARPNSLDDNTTTLEDRIVTPGTFDVRFYDLHGKLFMEDNRGNRWMLSGYSGFNNTEQDAMRLVRQRPARPDSPLVRETFETRNRWGNNSANLGLYRPLDEARSIQVRTGLSYYHTRYLKEDFSYQRPGRNAEDHIMFIHPFQNRSELSHFYAEADLVHYRPFDWDGRFGRLFPELDILQSGLAVHGYRSAYLEESLNRPGYFLESTPLLLEGYLDSHWKSRPDQTGLPLDIQTGVRLQHFSDGGYFRVSPRIKMDWLPRARISPSIGYSRTYQYLYKLSFYNQTTSDIWIAANEHQKPAAVDMWSAALRIRIAHGWFLRSEWYYKHQRNLRFHEINIQSVQSPLEGAPWFADNTGYARGWELQAGFSGRRMSVTQSYTLSRVELSNPRLNQGERFLAYWDRLHQSNTLVSLNVLSGLRVDGNWVLASGVPDRLDLFRSGSARLGTYSRIDLSVRYDIASGPHRWTLQAGVYNLANRNNPWYRDWVLTLSDGVQNRRLEPVQVDFYDLGFQPSFSIRYFFDP